MIHHKENDIARECCLVMMVFYCLSEIIFIVIIAT